MFGTEIGPEIQGVSPEASPSALGRVYLLIAVVFWKLDELGCFSPPLLLSCSRYCRWGWRWGQSWWEEKKWKGIGNRRGKGREGEDNRGREKWEGWRHEMQSLTLMFEWKWGWVWRDYSFSFWLAFSLSLLYLAVLFLLLMPTTSLYNSLCFQSALPLNDLEAGRFEHSIYSEINYHIS